MFLVLCFMFSDEKKMSTCPYTKAFNIELTMCQIWTCLNKSINLEKLVHGPSKW